MPQLSLGEALTNAARHYLEAGSVQCVGDRGQLCDDVLTVVLSTGIPRHDSEIVNRRWAGDLRSTLLCVGSFLSLLILIDDAAGTLTLTRAVLWSGLALLLLLVLMPPRVSVGKGRLTVRTLRGTRRVCTDRLVGVYTTGHAGQCLVLVDDFGGRVEFDHQILAANPAL